MYERILVAVDGSPTSRLALIEALRLAKLAGARVQVVNVVEDPAYAIGLGGYAGPHDAELFQQQKWAGRQVLDAALAAAKAQGVEADCALIEGIPKRVSDCVIDEATRWGAQLIVVGTHGRRGVRRVVLGSDAEQILRNAPVPVLLVRSPGFPDPRDGSTTALSSAGSSNARFQLSNRLGGTKMYERILVAVDGSPTSDRGLAEAIQLASLTHARLRLVNVVDEMSVAMGMPSLGAVYTGEMLQGLKEAGEEILETARATAAAHGVEAETALFEGFSGRVSDLVVEEAKRWSANLIVVGTHGRRGVRRFMLGSDAEQIVRTAPVPVLLVRMDSPDIEEATDTDAPAQTGIRP